MSIVNENDSFRSPLIISPQNPATNSNGTIITMLPSSYPNNYTLNSLDISL